MKQYFGDLTLKQKKILDIKSILHTNDIDIDFLFQNSLNELEQFSVIEEERKMALENLRTLTALLQNKRSNINKANKYFST